MEGQGSRARQAEVEVDQRPDFLHLSLNRNLPITLADFFSILLVSWLAIQFVHLSEMNAWAGSPPSPKSTTRAGDAERGRAVFNGKVVSYYCHGIDANKDQRPKLTADTAALIAQLNPPPADLRNPWALYLKTDKQRTRAIRKDTQAQVCSRTPP